MTKFNHRQNSNVSSTLREIVFGVEDGMVSTLGAITGIAIGTQNHFTVLLAGITIISVEAISMGMGSYISNQSGQEVDKRLLKEEEIELDEFPKEEKVELFDSFVADGWSREMAEKMIDEAERNKNLMLKEMTYRELKISTKQEVSSPRLGLYMFFSYTLGGLIPLFSYFLMPINLALKTSVFITLVGLFVLGIITSKYTKTKWLKSGLRVLLVGSIALVIGFLVGKIGNVIR